MYCNPYGWRRNCCCQQKPSPSMSQPLFQQPVMAASKIFTQDPAWQATPVAAQPIQPPLPESMEKPSEPSNLPPEQQGVQVPAQLPPQPLNQSYYDFIKNNPAVGYLKVQASRGQQTIPTRNVQIIITKLLDGEQTTLFQGFTDENGIIDNIALPAPPMAKSLSEYAAVRGETYALYAYHPEYVPGQYVVEIFEGAKAILPINMRLK